MLRTKTNCNNIKEIRKIAGGYEVYFNRSTDFMIKNFDNGKTYYCVSIHTHDGDTYYYLCNGDTNCDIYKDRFRYPKNHQPQYINDTGIKFFSREEVKWFVSMLTKEYSFEHQPRLNRLQNKAEWFRECA
jgi:hypothetical protein